LAQSEVRACLLVAGNDAVELYKGIRKYMRWYNIERSHSLLDD